MDTAPRFLRTSQSDQFRKEMENDSALQADVSAGLAVPLNQGRSR